MSVMLKPCEMNAQPTWWTESDAVVCQAYWSEEARQDMPASDAPDLEADTEYMEALEAFCQAAHPRYMEYTCRRCRFWNSTDGKQGRCSGPETSCGITEAISMCEQWEARTQPNLL